MSDLFSPPGRTVFPDDPPSTLEATWWLMDREPGMDDIMEKAGESLDTMTEDLGVEVFRDRDGEKRVFLARFEFPKWGEEFTKDNAVFVKDGVDDVVGAIAFLAGFPIDCVEMMVAIGQYASRPDKTTIEESDGQRMTAPVPENFFTWDDGDKVIFNLTALAVNGFGKVMAENWTDEERPQKTHWWFGVNLKDQVLDYKRRLVDVKVPVPGEFLGLGVRMMPDVPWWKQKSSPFIWSGNWMDTVFYSSGEITAINEPTAEQPYPTYEVTWRKQTLTLTPSDFAEYRVGDRVTILKDIGTTKTSQLWKDEDMETAGETWQAVPVTFYGLEEEED